MHIHTQCFWCRLFSRSNALFLAVLAGVALLLASPTFSAGNVPSDSAAQPETTDTLAEKTAKAEQQKKIASLVVQLGDKDYFVRQKAQEELSNAGFDAFEALTAAATSDDLEVATRAKYLLKLMRVEWTTAADSPDVRRLLKGYEMLDVANREERIHALASLPEGKATAALCRLARYEKSSVLSKRAALDLLQSPARTEPPRGEEASAIRKTLDRGSRPAVQWIGAWLRMARDPQAALDDFQRFIEAETQLLQRSPDETNKEIIAALMRYRIAQLKRLGKNDAVAPAMRRLIELQKDDASAIAELAEWFLDQKDWASLDELAQKSGSRFNAEPIPLYLYAAAKLAQNDAKKAEELATQALKLNASRESLPQHYSVAYYLQRKGYIPWAINEFEYLITQAGDQEYFAYRAVFTLAQIYHDQGKYLEAGKTLDKYLNRPSLRRLFTPQFAAEMPLGQARSEMYYYYGCHWESQGDRKQQRDNMEKSLKEDSTNVNALIGYYHLPDLAPAEKQKIAALVKKTVDATREVIRNDQQPPEDFRENLMPESKEANDCNQFAWLVANTEGDMNEALKYAKRAVELQPGSGGILDTLAHVYFAKGDIENAVKTQEKAAELEPHSELIKKKLAVFKKALAEKK
jgi:hypothetical protein